MARLDFNVSDVPEDTGDRSFDPIPAGDYIVQVVESEIRDTKAGTGKQLVLTLEVVDGPFTGRKLWDRLNIVNQSPEAQRISQRSLADLCMAIGISDLRDSEVLHYRPLAAKVGIRPAEGQYGPQNTVRYKKTPVSQNRSPAKPPGIKPWQRT